MGVKGLKRRETAKRVPKAAKSKNAPQIAFTGVHEHMPASASVPVLHVPAVFADLYTPHCWRYKIFYGGRGGGKSWAFADALLTIGMQRRIDVLCARELQVSIKNSVHKLLRNRIETRGLEGFYTVTDTGIRGRNGTLFSFRGLRHNATEIKSFEGVDYCWVEEAQKVSQESWDVLRPTIRKEGSEIWISFNPGTPHDPTWSEFVVNPPQGALVRKVTYRDNPWFTSALEAERLDCFFNDPDKYNWIWEGEPRVVTEAQIFKNRWRVEDFAVPTDGVRFRQGADWGFGSDPSVLVRSFMPRLPGAKPPIYICNEAWAVGLEIDDLPDLFDIIPGSRKTLIRADSSRPELVKYMRRKKFIIKGAKKWAGSIEDGIGTLRSHSLVIHPSCEQTIREMQLYTHKVETLTGEVLPDIVDANNHCCDAMRYAHEDVTRGRIGKAA